ncbi:MAG: hypothetical protein CMN30_01220 [Sandaracinus sp.]|nr:hypothetical protein [Sandaracinus sp.]
MSLAFRLAAFVAVFVFTTGALAQTDEDRDRARAAFQRGVSAYEAEHWEEALQAFQEAYRIAPHPSVRVNMANAYLNLGRPVQALDHFERFLLEMGDDGDPAQKREVRRQITELRSQIGEVFVRVQPEGATVTIDGHTTRRAPILDALELAAGTHHVEVAMEGYRSQEQEFQVSGGERHEVRIELEQGADAPVVADGPTELDASDDVFDASPEEEADDESGGIPGAVWVAGGATVALAIGAAVVGGLALGANGDFDDAVARSNDPTLPPAERNQAVTDGLDAADRADRLAITADILGIAAIAGAGATVLVYFLTRDEPDESVAVAPAAGPDGAGLVVRGAF